MNSRRSQTQHEARTTRRASALTVALMAIALGAIVTGCIKNYDPRDDSSRIDTYQSPVLAMVIAYDPA